MKSTPTLFLLQKDSSSACTSQGSILSLVQSNNQWLNNVPQDLWPLQSYIHQDPALPVSLVLRPALAEPPEASKTFSGKENQYDLIVLLVTEICYLKPSSEVCANWGTAGKELKKTCACILLG